MGKSERVSHHGEGYIMLYRKSLTSAVFQDEKTWKVWSWCILRANWNSIPIDFDGEQVTLRRGEFVTGSHKMVGELEMSISTVWRHLRKLEKWGNIGIKTGRRFTVITVLNYDVYQDPSRSEFALDGIQTGTYREPSGNLAGTYRQQIISKEYEERKEVKKEARPESLESVTTFFSANNASPKDAQDFFDHFSSNGWKVGGRAPMKDWHAAARKWIRNIPEFKHGGDKKQDEEAARVARIRKAIGI